MRSIAHGVRLVGVGLSWLVIFRSTADAQVAIQVRSGTTWTSTIELKALGPITFRWRWDGAETPTGVAWQLATVTPTSTATTRTSDVIASETPIRLSAPSGVKGGYEEFTVNPAASWPATFYIRMRVNIGRQSVYSRWISASIVQRTDVAANPTCAVEASKHRLSTTIDPATGGPGMVIQITEPIVPGEKVGRAWTIQKIRITFKNRVNTSVSYRRDINLFADGKPRALWFHGEDPKKTHALEPSGADTFEHIFATDDNGVLAISSGVIRMTASVTPVSGISSECSLEYVITP